MREALDSGKLEQFERSAHPLGGLMSDFAPRAAIDSPLKCESNGPDAMPAELEDNLSRLEEEVSRLQEALTPLVAERTS